MGGYNDKTPGKGIYVYGFNETNGKTKLISSTDSVKNPSYLSIDPSGKFIYACTETRTTGAGSVSAFRFDRKIGKIEFINKQPAGGDNPVYVSIHKNGKWLAIGSYSSGSLAVFPLKDDGSILPFSQNIQHTGSGLKPNQNQPHVHAVVFSPSYDRLFVPDLGLDKIFQYRFDGNAEIPMVDTSFTSVLPGSGPRHFTFHPNGKYAYLIEEMGGAVMAYTYNSTNGQLDSIQRILTHHEDSTGDFQSADIHISPDGKFLYASNRTRQNNIAIFYVDQSSGRLKLLGYESTRGKTPRNFVIDPSGKFLLVANQGSNNIVVFKRNKKTGMLTATGEEINTPEPGCLKMVRK
ncbi:MAG: lactonase family protein [Flavisolibacter sp.]